MLWPCEALMEEDGRGSGRSLGRRSEARMERNSQEMGECISGRHPLNLSPWRHHIKIPRPIQLLRVYESAGSSKSGRWLSTLVEVGMEVVTDWAAGERFVVRATRPVVLPKAVGPFASGKGDSHCSSNMCSNSPAMLDNTKMKMQHRWLFGIPTKKETFVQSSCPPAVRLLKSPSRSQCSFLFPFPVLPCLLFNSHF